MDNNTLLANLLQHPEKVGPAHIPLLEEFLLKYPYVQPLHILLAKADQKYVPKAALYSNNTALHKILHVDYTSKTEDISTEFEETISSDENEISSKKLNENLIIESAIANDFFSFEQSFTTETVSEEVNNHSNNQYKFDDTVISKYDDDALPYTFLWWLAKTRKEHAQIFQPYAQPVQNVSTSKTNGPEFQQQYVEHIFHIQTPFEVSDHLAEFKPNVAKDPKSTEIIDRFLKEDPTIKAPKPEQIDNENKAKKSAEDHYDLVSETLAKIYIEQMLYHKAIDTYKKLSLKYPEKSRYFADLIQSIEKKF